MHWCVGERSMSLNQIPETHNKQQITYHHRANLGPGQPAQPPARHSATPPPPVVLPTEPRTLPTNISGRDIEPTKRNHNWAFTLRSSTLSSCTLTVPVSKKTHNWWEQHRTAVNFICTHPVEVPVLGVEVPLSRDVPGQDAEVREPVPAPLAAAEDRHDDVVVGGDEGLGIVDRVEGARARHVVIGLGGDGEENEHDRWPEQKSSKTRPRRQQAVWKKRRPTAYPFSELGYSTARRVTVPRRVALERSRRCKWYLLRF